MIIRMMERKGVENGMMRIIKEYLKGRVVETHEERCPQGLSLGPTLWLYIMKDMFVGMIDT